MIDGLNVILEIVKERISKRIGDPVLAEWVEKKGVVIVTEARTGRLVGQGPLTKQCTELMRYRDIIINITDSVIRGIKTNNARAKGMMGY